MIEIIKDAEVTVTGPVWRAPKGYKAVAAVPITYESGMVAFRVFLRKIDEDGKL